MNNSYKIKEISRLYGLCSDTLRYYEEQGLLSPKRGENRYRMFGVQDIGKLNVIRSLRELDIPLERIREYIHNRDIDSTLRLLDEEETLILSQIERLREKYEDINARKTELQKDRQIEIRIFQDHGRIFFEFRIPAVNIAVLTPCAYFAAAVPRIPCQKRFLLHSPNPFLSSKAIPHKKSPHLKGTEISHISVINLPKVLHIPTARPDIPPASNPAT